MFRRIRQTLATLLLASAVNAAPTRDITLPVTHLTHDNDHGFVPFVEDVLETHYSLLGFAFDNLPSQTSVKRGTLVGSLAVANAWLTGVAHEYVHHTRKDKGSIRADTSIGILPGPKPAEGEHNMYEFAVQSGVPFYFHDKVAQDLRIDMFMRKRDVDDGINMLVNSLASPLYSALILTVRQGDLISNPNRLIDRSNYFDLENWAIFTNTRYSSYTVFNGEKNDWMQEDPGRIEVDATHVAWLDVGLALLNAETYHTFAEIGRFVSKGDRKYDSLNIGSNEVRISPPFWSLALTPYGAIPSVDVLYGIGNVALYLEMMISLESTQKIKFGPGNVYRQEVGMRVGIDDETTFDASLAVSEYAQGSHHPEPFGFEANLGMQFPLYAGFGLKLDGTFTYNDLNESRHLSEHDLLEPVFLGLGSVVYRLPN